MTDLLPGTYVCLGTGSLFGRIIRLVTKSPVNHTFVVTGPGEIVEATGTGVMRNPLSKYAGCAAVANLNEPVTEAQRNSVASAALVYAIDKDEYAWPGIAAIGLRRLGLKWGWLLKISADHDALFCSELAVEAGAAAGLDWSCGEPSAACVDPGELARRPGCVPVTIGR